jgi:effector-binding domain-containing protein
MPLDQPELRDITEQWTAVRRAVVARDELVTWLAEAFGEVATYLSAHGIAPKGFPFTRCHAVPGHRYAVEAGFPISVRIAGNGSVRPSTLPGGPAVVAWHAGSYDSIAQTYQAIDNWLQDEGGYRTGDAWETYHDPSSRDQPEWRTEVVQPIAFAGVNS